MRLTNQDKVLHSVALASDNGRYSISASDVILAAWERYPEDFGLEGKIHTHPDASKILYLLMGKEGMIARGLLSKVEKRYTLTTQGAARLDDVGVDTDKAAPPPTVTDDQKALVRRLLASAVYTKIEAGRKNDVSRSDIDDFYCLPDNGKPGGVDAAINGLHQMLNDIECVLDRLKSVTLNGVVLDGSLVRLLRNYSDLCQEKHKKYLDLRRF